MGLPGGTGSLLCMLLLALSVNHRIQVMAADYTVGDEDKWRDSISYLDWSQKYNFTVGDVLVFNYIKGQHNVKEVTEGAYRTCDTSTGVLKEYDTGTDRVELTQARKYWFVCTIDQHCLGGMKFGVTVMAAGSGNGTTAAPSPAAETMPGGGTNGGGRVGGRWVWAGLAAVVGLLELF